MPEDFNAVMDAASTPLDDPARPLDTPPVDPAVPPVMGVEPLPGQPAPPVASTDDPGAAPSSLAIDPEAKYVVNGQELSGRELLDQRMMQSDYTQKTQEVATLRRDMNAVLEDPVIQHYLETGQVAPPAGQQPAEAENPFAGLEPTDPETRQLVDTFKRVYEEQQSKLDDALGKVQGLETRYEKDVREQRVAAMRQAAEGVARKFGVNPDVVLQIANEKGRITNPAEYLDFVMRGSGANPVVAAAPAAPPPIGPTPHQPVSRSGTGAMPPGEAPPVKMTGDISADGAAIRAEMRKSGYNVPE